MTPNNAPKHVTKPTDTTEQIVDDMRDLIGASDFSFQTTRPCGELVWCPFALIAKDMDRALEHVAMPEEARERGHCAVFDIVCPAVRFGAPVADAGALRASGFDNRWLISSIALTGCPVTLLADGAKW